MTLFSSATAEAEDDDPCADVCGGGGVGVTELALKSVLVVVAMSSNSSSIKVTACSLVTTVASSTTTSMGSGTGGAVTSTTAGGGVTDGVPVGIGCIVMGATAWRVLSENTSSLSKSTEQVLVTLYLDDDF